MATQALVEQTLIFISSTGNFNETSIFGNSLIQQMAANSIGSAVVYAYKSYQTWNATTQTWTPSMYLEFKCFVTSAFQTTIQNNISALRTQLPQYSIYTYGEPTTWGF